MSRPMQNVNLTQELELRNAAQKGDLVLVKSLILQGINVNAVGPKTKRTALHWAAKCKYYKVVEALLKSGADQTLKDKDNNTPLLLAEKIENNDAVVEILRSQFILKTKEDKERMDQIGNTSQVKEIDEKVICTRIERLEKQLTKDYAEHNDILLKYVTHVESYIKTITVQGIGSPQTKANSQHQGFWSYLFGSTTKSESDNFNALVDIQNKLIDETRKRFEIKIIDKHFLGVKNVFTLISKPELLSQFISQMSTKDAAEVNITFKEKIIAVLSAIIVRQVILNRKIKLEVAGILEYIKTLSIKDKNIVKNFKKCLKGLLSKSEKNLIDFKNTIKENFSECFVNPLGFFIFLDNYFKEDTLNCLDDIYSFTESAKKDAKLYTEELMALSKRFKPVVLSCFKYYLQETSESIQKLIKDNHNTVAQLALMKDKELEKVEAQNSFRRDMSKIIEDIISNNIKDFDNSFICTGNYFYFMYRLGQRLIITMKEVLESIDSFSTEYLKETALMIRENFVKNLNIKSTSFVSNFEEIRLREKQFSKEREYQKRIREESKRTESALILNQKKYMEENIIADNKMKEECIAKIFSKLCRKKDVKLIQKIFDILNKDNITMLKKDFYKCLIKLEISGYEKIQSNMSVANNKVTLVLGKFYSFTLHEKHGKDNIDDIDVASIQELRKMLESINVNKNNFWEIVEKYSISSPIVQKIND
jgi:hypothetical protein